MPSLEAKLAPLYRRAGGVNEVQLGGVLRDSGLQYLERHPGQLALASAFDALRLVDLGSGRGFAAGLAYAEMSIPAWMQWLSTASARLLVDVALLVLLARATRRGRLDLGPWWLWAIPVAVVVVTIPTVGNPLKRAPLDPFLILIAAIGAAGAAEAMRSRSAIAAREGLGGRRRGILAGRITPGSDARQSAAVSNPSTEPPPAAPARRGRLRLALAGVAAMLPLIPIVIALALSGGSGAGAGTAANSASLFKPVSTASAPLRRPLLTPPGTGALVALVQRATPMRSIPGGHAYAKVAAHTEFGSPEAMWVVKVSGRWLGVISPIAGNGRVGWIAAADASLSRVDWELRVSLSARRLSVLHNGRTVRRYTVAVGQPAAPTPTGRFAVSDRLRTGDPSGPYGCCILALTAKAPHVIQGWSGGDRIAIHSTPETATIGKPVSHGCLRLTLAEGRWLLGHIPLGTPTLISG